MSVRDFLESGELEKLGWVLDYEESEGKKYWKDRSPNHGGGIYLSVLTRQFRDVVCFQSPDHPYQEYSFYKKQSSECIALIKDFASK